MSVWYDNTLPSTPPMLIDESNLSNIEDDSMMNNLSSNHICAIFDDLIAEFQQMEKHGGTTLQIFLDAVEQVANVVLTISPYKLLDPKVRSHSLMCFLHQIFHDLLMNWRESPLRLNIQETYIFLKIIFIFVQVAEEATTLNIDHDPTLKKDLFIINELWFSIHEKIDYAVMNQIPPPNDFSICALGLLTLKLISEYPFNYDMKQDQQLIYCLVMDWLDSYDLKQVADRIEHGETIKDIEYNILLICWKSICSRCAVNEENLSNISLTNLLSDLSDEFLTRIEHTLDESQSIEPKVLAHLYKRNQQILNVHCLSTFDKHTQNIIERLINILQNPQPTNTVDDNTLIFIALKTFQSLSRNPKILTLMKNRHLVPLFNQYASNEISSIRKMAVNLLVKMMDEQESYEFDLAVKSLDNEIQSQNKKLTEVNDTANMTQTATAYRESKDVTKEHVLRHENVPTLKYMKDNISQWNEEKVRDFLIKQNLTEMVLLCNGINGEELCNLYSMCKKNSASMYRSLKSELLTVYSEVLTISSYLHFMHRLDILFSEDV